MTEAATLIQDAEYFISEDSKPNLLSIADADAMSMEQTVDMFRENINPSLGKLYAMLGLASRKPLRAKGTSIYMEDGSEVLDMTSGISVLNLGHNHPRIMRARKKWADQDRLEVWKFIPSPHQSVLAKNLATLMPGDVDISFFCNSGAEANEGALKLASKYAGAERDLVIHTDISFHGKTHATLSLSGSENGSDHFKKMPGCLEVPYGDAAALEALIKEHKPAIGKSRVSTFIVEPIRSEGVIVPPEGYLRAVRRICSQYDVVLICDEVFCGFGRTGKLFSFEHEGITPDIVSISKAFGAGKATFAAFVASRKIFTKAYGSIKDATLHSTTYNGYGEELVAAIEGLHILHDEDLIENSRILGERLLNGLQEIQQKHPTLVTSVSGCGLLACIKTENVAAKTASRFRGLHSMRAMGDVVSKLTTGGIIAQLYEKHSIMTFTPQHDPNQILLVPPLVITANEIDRFLWALDDVLNSNFVTHGWRFAQRALV